LGDKKAVDTLFKEVAGKIADRPGGYTRILKTGARLGDNADMCFIELVDYNENMLGGKSASKAKPARRGRKKPGAKKIDADTAVEVQDETKDSKASE
jgi:large subunit ribosomal protein L17